MCCPLLRVCACCGQEEEKDSRREAPKKRDDAQGEAREEGEEEEEEPTLASILEGGKQGRDWPPATERRARSASPAPR